jgi:hypothetical protein
MKIRECIDQIELCNYECKGGFLKNNIAWIELKRKLLTELYQIIQLPCKEPVQYVGVYVLHWKDHPENPEVGFIMEEA